MKTIEAPSWCSDAVPVMNEGWVSPSGEVMVSSRFTQPQMDEWQKANTPVTADDITIVEGKWDAEESRMSDSPVGFIGNTLTNVDMPSVAAVSKDAMSFDHTDVADLKGMSKIELEELGREHGVELDRRKSKKALVKTMKDLLS